jgi:hypothetical protein
MSFISKSFAVPELISTSCFLFAEKIYVTVFIPGCIAETSDRRYILLPSLSFCEDI